MVRQLPKHGWKTAVVHLAAGAESLTERELALVEELPRHEIPIGFDRTRTGGGSSLAPTRTRGPTLADRLDRALPVDGWLLWLLFNSPGALRFARRWGPDVVVSTADPWSSHVLGARLARALHRPHIADFRDPWTLCPVRTKDRPGWTQAADRKVEASVLRRAHRAVFTAEQTTRRYRTAYPERADRFTTIENAYDSERQQPNPCAVVPGPLELLFLGRFRPLSSAQKAIKLLSLVSPDVRTDIRIRSVGGLQGRDRDLARKAGVLDRFQPLDPVPHERVSEVTAQADILLLSTEPGRDEILPAKLFDYLPAGRPILALSQNPDIEAILGSTGTGEQLDLRAAASQLEASVQAKRHREPLALRFAPVPGAIERFSAETFGERWASVLRAALP